MQTGSDIISLLLLFPLVHTTSSSVELLQVIKDDMVTVTLLIWIGSHGSPQ